MARHGMSDWRFVDPAAAEFLLAIVEWERNHDDRRWPSVLGSFNNVVSAT